MPAVVASSYHNELIPRVEQDGADRFSLIFDADDETAVLHVPGLSSAVLKTLCDQINVAVIRSNDNARPTLCPLPSPQA
jgi:hypothetical protein